LLASAWVDPLTGLRNRRGLEEALTREEARRRRSGASAAIILVDVVGLKRVNEQFGHLVGDALLRAVGQAFIASTRESDVVARFGGDEFVALLPGAESAGAEAFVSRLRGNARPAALPDGVTVPVRFTAGHATAEEAGTLSAALALADQRLIAEKQRGREQAGQTQPAAP
jgi:diguanylate cyclase (GGDEF)-like protein